MQQTGNRPEELECEAEVLFASGLVAGSVAEGKKAYSKYYELFVESSELFSKEDDRESLARTLSHAATASWFLVTYCSDRWEIEQLLQKGREVADKAWKLSKEIGNVQSLAESLFAESGLSWIEMMIATLRWDERWREYARKIVLRCDESLKLAEGYDDPSVLGMIYSMTGSWYCGFGTQLVKDEREQREYIHKGLELMEKGLVFVRETKDKSRIINSLWWLDYHARAHTPTRKEKDRGLMWHHCCCFQI